MKPSTHAADTSTTNSPLRLRFCAISSSAATPEALARARVALAEWLVVHGERFEAEAGKQFVDAGSTDAPKYYNSRESPLFVKSQHFYGIER